MIGRLNHVAIAVPDLETAAGVYRDQLGAAVGPVQTMPEHGVRIVFIDTGNSKIELLQPLDKTSPIAAFLARNGAGGMHHICFEVDVLALAIAGLQQAGARVLNEGVPRLGAHGRPVVFLHPGDFQGTLIELEEVPPAR